MQDAEKEKLRIESLPVNLHDAVKAMKQDAFICSVLGPHISEKYAEAKEAEWEAYREQVTDWEISSYLYRI